MKIGREEGVEEGRSREVTKEGGVGVWRRWCLTCWFYSDRIPGWALEESGAPPRSGGAQTEVRITGADSGQVTGSPLATDRCPQTRSDAAGGVQGLPPTGPRRCRVGIGGVLWGRSPVSGSSQVSPHFVGLSARAGGPLPMCPTGDYASDTRADTYITTSRDMLNIVLGTTLGLNMAVVQFFGDYLDLEC